MTPERIHEICSQLNDISNELYGATLERKKNGNATVDLLAAINFLTEVVYSLINVQYHLMKE